MSSSPIFYYTQLLHNFRLFGCTKLTIMTYVGALPMIRALGCPPSHNHQSCYLATTPS